MFSSDALFAKLMRTLDGRMANGEESGAQEGKASHFNVSKWSAVPRVSQKKILNTYVRIAIYKRRIYKIYTNT